MPGGVKPRTEREQRLRDQASEELARRWEVFRLQHPEVRFPDGYVFKVDEDNIEAGWILGGSAAYLEKEADKVKKVPVGAMPVDRWLPTGRRLRACTHRYPRCILSSRTCSRGLHLFPQEAARLAAHKRSWDQFVKEHGGGHVMDFIKDRVFSTTRMDGDPEDWEAGEDWDEVPVGVRPFG